MNSSILLTLFFFFLTSTTTFVTVTESANSNRLTFSDVSGSKLGDQKPGLSSVKRYLKRYGYLLTDSDTHDDSFDDALHSAVVQYQTFFHLNVTGVIDEPTVEAMVQPRCGIADLHVHHHGTNTTSVGVGHGRYLYAYFPGTPVWPPERRSLKFSFPGDDTIFPTLELSTVYRRAFSRWQAVTNLVFTEVDMNQSPDIVLQFFVGDHGDGTPFDAGLGILAHSSPPPLGQIHFDGSELWTESPDDKASPDLTNFKNAIDLESVAVHEIGHVLGLAHSSDTYAIMFPTLKPQTRKVELTLDDVHGIQNLYGVKG